MRFSTMVLIFDGALAGVLVAVGPVILSAIFGFIIGLLLAYWRYQKIHDDAHELLNRFRRIDDRARAEVETVFRAAELRLHLKR